jgi:hypothetical protein
MMLLPYVKNFVTILNERLVPYIERLVDVVGVYGLAGGFKMLGESFLDAVENGGKFTNILLGLSAAFVTLRLVSLAAAAAQTLFGVSLLMNPIGIIVAAVIALGVALAALYLKFEPVRIVVNAIGKALIATFKDIAEKVMNFFIIQINAVLVGINAMIWAANKLGADIEQIGYISLQSFDAAGDAAEAAAKRMALAQKQEGRPFEQLVGDYRGAMPKITKATNEVTTSLGGAGKAVKTLKERMASLIDSMKGVTNAQRGLRDANKATVKANEELAAANERLVLAQERFRRAVSGYGADSREARTQTTALAQAQRRLERSGYNVEQAVFAVAQAEADLAEIRLDPEATPQKIREAEIALAEAKLSVQDATEAQTEATVELANAEQRLDEIINGAKEGSDAYKEALDELNEAKRAQVDATDAVTDAYDRQRDAVDKLREAEEKLREERKGLTPAQIARATNMANTPLNIATPTAQAGFSTAGVPMPGESLIDFANRAFGANIPMLADGGIVKKATLAVVGEAGPEAVVPLNSNMGGGTNIYVTVNAGMGTDPARLGDEIVNVLQRYNRRNGALPLKVS